LFVTNVVYAYHISLIFHKVEYKCIFGVVGNVIIMLLQIVCRACQ